MTNNLKDRISDYLATLHQEDRIDCISINVEQMAEEIAGIVCQQETAVDKKNTPMKPILIEMAEAIENAAVERIIEEQRLFQKEGGDIQVAHERIAYHKISATQAKAAFAVVEPLLREMAAALEHYQAVDDNAVRFTKGFSATVDDVDYGSPARRALAAYRAAVGDAG